MNGANPILGFQKINRTKLKSQLKIEEEYFVEEEVKMRDKYMVDKMRQDHTGSIVSKRQSAINSTAKYREKKKLELGSLEQEVKDLENDVQQVETNIKNMKARITDAIETLTKVNQLATNENIEIYHEMELLLGKPNTKVQTEAIQPVLGGYDKFNLLLDTLKYRIGASGRERQTKLAYQFKSIVNTMFPALCRYILYSCVKKLDFFTDGKPKPSEWDWTNELCRTIVLTEEQLQVIKTYTERLINVFNSAINGVVKLDRIKGKFIESGIILEGTTDEIRELISPIQCAHWTLFAEKNKYRREILLDAPFFHAKEEAVDEDLMVFQKGMKGIKKVKLNH